MMEALHTYHTGRRDRRAAIVGVKTGSSSVATRVRALHPLGTLKKIVKKMI